MANNPGNNRSSIEFVVKPRKDLFLEGVLRKIPRVTKDEPYPCQMQKNQTFSCLFRHYAKHNGLKKEDELLPEQTPESVHLMAQDEIWVDHRIPPPESQSQAPKINNYNHSFRKLFLSGIHSDISFSFEDGTSIKAHKSIVSARSDYFEAMFKIDGMIESSQKDIKIDHDSKSFRRLLEFIYTDSVEDIEECSSSEVISLLVLANQYLLDDLRGLCELQVIEMIDMDNIGQLLLLSAGHNASILKKACNSFVEENRTTLVQNNSFRQEIEANPELGLILFEASASPVRLGFNKIGDENSQVNKKRRRSNDTENDFDLILPQLGNPNNTLTTNVPDNPNQAITIAQQNADVQES